MRKMESVRDQAAATIWEHCCDLFVAAFDLKFWRDLVTEWSVASVCLVVNLLLILAMPVSFPIIAVFRRRAARREIREWQEWLQSSSTDSNQEQEDHAQENNS